jgi:hypothetical protein
MWIRMSWRGGAWPLSFVGELEAMVVKGWEVTNSWNLRDLTRMRSVRLFALED